MWFKRFLVVWICITGILHPLHLAAQKTVRYDTTKTKPKQFNPKSLKEYASKKEFNYTEGKQKSGLTLWERFWNWVWEKLDSALSSKGSDLIFLILGGAALVFLVMKLVGMDSLKILSRKSAETGMVYEDEPTIYGVNFDAEIEKAVAAKDYRLAVRMLYLKCLKRLSDAGKIDWQPNKTNRAYALELNDGRKEKFIDLTRQFEYVWYGNFPVDADSYTGIRNEFSTFFNVSR